MTGGDAGDQSKDERLNITVTTIKKMRLKVMDYLIKWSFIKFIMTHKVFMPGDFNKPLNEQFTPIFCHYFVPNLFLSIILVSLRYYFSLFSYFYLR